MPVQPLYRARFGDGTTSMSTPTPTPWPTRSRGCADPRRSGLPALRRVRLALYRAEMRDFIDRNIDSPLQLLTPDLARLVALGGFRRLAPKVASYLHDPRLQRLFSFQSLYAGLSPLRRAGDLRRHRLHGHRRGRLLPARRHARGPTRHGRGAPSKHGVEIRYGTGVSRVTVENGRATGVVTTTGEYLPADVVVLGPDLPVAYRELLPGAACRDGLTHPALFAVVLRRWPGATNGTNTSPITTFIWGLLGAAPSRKSSTAGN